MIGIPGVRTYYLYRKPTDMRKSFSGLGGLVINEMGKDLLSGDGFIFINKRRTLIKILVCLPAGQAGDRNGFVIYYKRLERGTFEIPRSKAGSQKIEIPWSHLVMIIEGKQLKSIRQRLRYTG